MTKLPFFGDTIAAIATPIGEGGIGVIRLSGSDALKAAGKIFRSAGGGDIFSQATHTLQYGRIMDVWVDPPKSVDEILAVVMRAPRSYTREDVVELHCHGGRVVLQKVLDLCLRAGARLAEPGEFTRRAFLNGRIGLIEAEAVLDLIKADSECAYEAARRHLEGGWALGVTQIRDRLADALCEVEAALDFPEEGIDPMGRAEIREALESSKESVRMGLSGEGSARRIREGATAVLAGAPNVGKSSLMNAILSEERVLVSEIPGTTRDVVEEKVEIKGLAVRLLDTAGIRDSTDRLEEASMARAKEALERADLAVVVFDASRRVLESEKKIWEALAGRPRLAVINKMDLADSGAVKSLEFLNPWTPVRTTALTGSIQAVDTLVRRIHDALRPIGGDKSQEFWVFTVRQSDLLKKSDRHLIDALAALESGHPLEFVASDIRLALDALGELVGEVVTDDILDRLFQRFCIGK